MTNADQCRSFTVDHEVEQLKEPTILTSTEQASRFKCEINELIWRYGPKELTLGRADEIACNMMDAFIEGVQDTSR